VVQNVLWIALICIRNIWRHGESTRGVRILHEQPNSYVKLAGACQADNSGSIVKCMVRHFQSRGYIDLLRYLTNKYNKQ
jgi:hypothetical protein